MALSSSPPARSSIGPTTRVLERLEALFSLGHPPHAHRLGLSEEEERAHHLVASWMRDAGLEVEVDPIGNLFGRRPGTRSDLAEVWVGSHLDTVPAGGRFDGALGVIAGLEAVLRLDHRTTDRAITVVAFRDEEGVRFGRSCLGSRALCGQLEPGELESADGNGVTVAAALDRQGRRPDEIPASGWLARNQPCCFVELHIEQGPVLAGRGATVGVVESIVGLLEHRVSFTGRSTHAGTTPMADRADALVAAAAFIARIDAKARAGGTVMTVGDLQVEPGVPNVVAGRAQLPVDSRGTDAKTLSELESFIETAASDSAGERGVRASVTRSLRVEPVVLDAGVNDTLVAVGAEHGDDVQSLSSGAGHDAGVLASAGVPTGMLFVRSLAGGLSHHPDEETDDEAIGDSITVLTTALERLAHDGRRTANAGPDQR
jgi:hydantoinase/carbamoylase family amidase